MTGAARIPRVDDETGVGPLLERAWPGSRRDIEDVLFGLEQHGAEFILFNLPVHCEHEKLPNDLDLLFSPEGFARAMEYLSEEQFIPLSYTPARHQRLLVGRLSNGRFIRLHLHSDLWFSGVRLIRYDAAARFVQRMNGLRVPSAELDYTLLLLQWHFRRKPNYIARVRQCQTSCDRVVLGQVTQQCERVTQALLPKLESGCEQGEELPLFGIGWQYWVETARIWSRRIGSLLTLKRRGRMVYLMGIDGTGKTSLAEGMVEAHDSGLFARSTYLGLKNTLVQKVRRLLIRQDEREQYVGQSGVADRLATKSGLLSNLFNLGLSLVYIAEYFLKINLAMRHVRKGNNLLVIDRGHYDKLTEPHKWGNKLFYYLLPAPDLIIGLTGEAQKLYERKREFEPEVLAQMQGQMDLAWRFLESQGEEVLILDSTQLSLNDCLFRLNREVWDRFFQPRKS